MATLSGRGRRSYTRDSVDGRTGLVGLPKVLDHLPSRVLHRSVKVLAGADVGDVKLDDRRPDGGDRVSDGVRA